MGEKSSSMVYNMYGQKISFPEEVQNLQTFL